MATRPTIKGQPLIVYVAGKSAAAIVEGVGVIWDSGTADVATAGTNAFGVAMESATGDGTTKLKIALLSSANCIIKVKVSAGGATQGAYAICGSGGFENQTLGGGTTVKYIAGKFHETGVSGDYVGLEVGQFAGVA